MNDSANSPWIGAEPSNVIIMSSVRWDFIWQRHQSLAREFSESGCNVVFCDPHPRGVLHAWSWIQNKINSRSASTAVGENPRGTVRVIPWAPRHAFSKIRYAEIRNNLAPGTVLALLYLPSRSNLVLLKDLCPDYVVYDNVLDWSEVPKSWFPPRGWKANESALYGLSRNGKVALTTDSRSTGRLLERAGLTVQVVHPAADEEFSHHEWQSSMMGPVGYFGTVRYDEIDVQYLRELAEVTPTVVIGDIDEPSRALLESSKVEILGRMGLSKLVAEINQWSGIVLPYRKTGRTNSLMPAKIWNAIATRKPVFVKNLELDKEIRDFVLDLPSDPRRFTIDRNTQFDAVHQVPSWRDRASDIKDLAQACGLYLSREI